MQEFFGYALLLVTKAQKMLILIGKGGEGKSRVGLVLRSLLGENMNTAAFRKWKPTDLTEPIWNTSC